MALDLDMVFVFVVFRAREECFLADKLAGLQVFTYLIATVAILVDKALGWILN